ncbi:hypothetical protein [Actinoplanes utahensis]|uniref:hypothetical protein n=1 Tax=Actinoplanes utahensis TaxID=1869 RepID=UPI00126A0B78|nr:hypothetical protein [Actinoplanes utahensis]GIF31523.1 hypothetical protein Aut01nite_45090 [Actinoplanes utahensis]
MTRWAWACGVFVVGEVILRLYWIAGGRWGYTACDRADPTDPVTGCGAEQVVSLPFWAGWGALIVAAGLSLVIARGSALAAWIAAAFLMVAAFPLHLLFQIPAAFAGRPTDWRDIGARLALTAGGLAFAGLANARGPRRGPAAPGYRPVPRWARRWAYAAVAVSVAGWALPHALWVLGVPFGVSGDFLARAGDDLAAAGGVAITVVPPLAGLLVLGLVQRWGQEFPRWLPVLGGRPVPRMLAVVPAGTVALTMFAYGVLSVGVFLDQEGWTYARQNWATTATLAVFMVWGLAVGVTTAGYLTATRR